jgi:hypothetical protein
MKYLPLVSFLFFSCGQADVNSTLQTKDATLEFIQEAEQISHLTIDHIIETCDKSILDGFNKHTVCKISEWNAAHLKREGRKSKANCVVEVRGHSNYITISAQKGGKNHSMRKRDALKCMRWGLENGDFLKQQ